MSKTVGVVLEKFLKHLCYIYIFVCLRSVSCVQCCLYILGCPFLIALSVFSNVYLQNLKIHDVLTPPHAYETVLYFKQNVQFKIIAHKNVRKPQKLALSRLIFFFFK